MTVLMAGALVMSMSGAVGAASPETMIKACVNKSTKIVRISVYASTTWCESTEAYKEWAITGPKGDTGTDGTDGVDGADGADGVDGADGTDGVDGLDGKDGADGAPGADGVDGIDGADGKDGADGAPGVDGADGAKGDKGDKGDPGVIASTSIENSSEGSYDSTIKTATKTVSCPSGTTMLGGGGIVTTTDSAEKAALATSYPSALDTWTVVGAAKVGAGKVWTLQAYALCGANPS